jgi:hypothetical protein
MITPSILVEVIDGKPVCSVLDVDADKALNAYKKSNKEAYLFIRPAASKRKNALAPAKKSAKKSGKSK